MHLTIIQTRTSPVVDEFAEKMAELNLLCYATAAAAEMGFETMEELHESVKRAMEICIRAEIPLKENFQTLKLNSNK